VKSKAHALVVAGASVAGDEVVKLEARTLPRATEAQAMLCAWHHAAGGETCTVAPGRTNKPVMATASLKSSSHRTEPGSSAHRRYCCELFLPSKLNTSVRAVLTAAPSRVTGTAGVQCVREPQQVTAGHKTAAEGGHGDHH